MPDPAADQLNEYQRALDQRNAPNPGVPPVGQPFLADPVLPISTAGADQPQLFPTGVDVHPVVAAVVQSVQATSEPHNWAMTAAAVLQALQPTQDAWMAVSRASPKTQASVMLGEQTLVALAGILQLFFPHPRAG